jgi:hypothetical protein
MSRDLVPFGDTLQAEEAEERRTSKRSARNKGRGRRQDDRVTADTLRADGFSPAFVAQVSGRSPATKAAIGCYTALRAPAKVGQVVDDRV